MDSERKSYFIHHQALLSVLLGPDTGDDFGERDGIFQTEGKQNKKINKNKSCMALK